MCVLNEAFTAFELLYPGIIEIFTDILYTQYQGLDKD